MVGYKLDLHHSIAYVLEEAEEKNNPIYKLSLRHASIPHHYHNLTIWKIAQVFCISKFAFIIND